MRDVPGQVITFYSFKGGTGRSMALANAACLLAERDGAGDILIVDWDLEAPGIDRYFGRYFHQKCGTGPQYWPTYLARPGLLDFFEAAQKRLAASTDSTKASGAQLMETLDPEPYLTQTDVPRVWIMKAGRFSDDYGSRVNTFKWEALYHACPDLFRVFAAKLAQRFEFVLVDSRTGVTDTSGICTMLIPEKVVVVFTPNLQSLAGATEFVSKVAEYRRASDDVRPLTVYPLPSRIEPSEPDKKTWWRFGNEKQEIKGYQPAFEELFRKVYGLTDCSLQSYFDEVQIQYLGPFSYGEEIAVLLQSDRAAGRLSLSESYRSFLGRLLDSPAPWLEPAKPDHEKALVESRGRVENLEKALEGTAKTKKLLWGSVGGLLALLGGLAAVAIPAYNDYAARAQVTEGVVKAAGMRTYVAEYFAEKGKFPSSIADLDFGPNFNTFSDPGKYVESVHLGPEGRIIATFKKDVANIGGKTFVFVPRAGSKNVLDWSCAGGTIDQKYLPSTCKLPGGA